MERVKGIEPSYAAWEAAVLPLNYTRVNADFTVFRADQDRPGSTGYNRNALVKKVVLLG
jgi:hypothetical protein